MKIRNSLFVSAMLVVAALTGGAFAADALKVDAPKADAPAPTPVTLTVALENIVIANGGNKTFVPASLQMDLKFLAPDRATVSDIRNVRLKPNVATDATGLELVNPKKFKNEWQHLFAGSFKIEFDSPASAAKTLRELSGSVEIYNPKADLASVITIPNVSQQLPQTLDNPLLKAAGIRINVLTKTELDGYRNSLRTKSPYPAASKQALTQVFGDALDNLFKGKDFDNQANFAIHIEDLNDRLIDKDLRTPDDKSVSVSSSSTGGTSTYTFYDSPPLDFGLRLYVATPKSVMEIPFKFTDVALPVRAQEPAVSATNLTDERRSGFTFIPSSLDVDLKIATDAVAQARSVRVAVASATDATGKSLLTAKLHENKWDDIKATDNRQTTSASIALDSPARAAATLREITGNIELYDPTRDLQSVITIADIPSHAGRTLDDATLKSLGLEIAFLNKDQADEQQKAQDAKPAPAGTPQLKPEVRSELIKAIRALFGGIAVDDKTLAFHVLDPNARFVDVALETAGGQIIPSAGRTRSGELQSYEFKEAIPADAHLKIYVATPKSVVEVPFKLTDVALP